MYLLDTVEWQTLNDTINDGGDWADYRYIRAIDEFTNKVENLTTHREWNIINL